MQNDIENILKNITTPAQSTMEFKFHTPNKMRKPKSKIAAYDINGYLIKTYDKIIDCVRDGFNATAVTKCVNGKRKLHNNFIFIRYKAGEEPRLKIDSSLYTIRKNSRKHKNLQILKTISEELNNKPKEKFLITKKHRTRIGMFEKDGTLFKVFLTTKDLEDYDASAQYAAYNQIYGRYNKKLKKGYKNKFHFRRLQVGETYIIGEKYNLADIPFDTQKVFIKNKNNIPVETPIPIENFNTVSVSPEVENLKNTVQELKNSIETLIKVPTEKVDDAIEKPKKKNFFQRLAYLFTGE